MSNKPTVEGFKVRMSSAEYGNEDFHYDTLDEAMASIRRLVARATASNDGVERIIGLVVNAAE